MKVADDTFYLNSECELINMYLIEEEVLIRSQTTTLLQIFCEVVLYSKVIFKSMQVADDNF